MDFFDIETIKSILLIVGIDIALGGDNAIVIALASRNLPIHQRNKAILFGTGLAIVIRVILTAFAVYLLQIPFLKLIGGLLLIYIALNLIISNEDDMKVEAKDNLIAAIQTIVFADIIMGFDNVLGIASASNGHIELVIIGLLVSVPIIIWGSKVILHFMEKYPLLVYIGAGILAYTAGETILSEDQLAPFFQQYQAFHYVIPIVSILFVLFLGHLLDKKQVRSS
ncbi:TerC family protein [Salirhabdus sp. Marseille-P4669]|uniref:TerC family protein n=1 Tax=Salirhabdus sp. Marseille-P4669 TaxID=2042310 RepID=UPI000C7E0D34|nr:TerC family protein [Salirhabdus sp. Marseille-P4669]